MGVQHDCSTCGLNAGAACMGYGIRTDNGQDTYGMDTEEAGKMFPNGCSDYEISVQAYITEEKINGR